MININRGLKHMGYILWYPNDKWSVDKFNNVEKRDYFLEYPANNTNLLKFARRLSSCITLSNKLTPDSKQNMRKL